MYLSSSVMALLLWGVEAPAPSMSRPIDSAADSPATALSKNSTA
jgi:hypothetical protein